MRKPLIVLLGLGVVAGYGSALAGASHRWHHGYDGGCHGRWAQRWQQPAPVAAAAPAPAPAAPAPAAQVTPPTVVPQIIIVQPQAAPAPQVFVQPQAAPAPQVFVQHAAPPTVEPKANAPARE